MANHHKTPIMLQKNDIVLVKPAKPTPSHALSFSTIDNSSNFEVICKTIYVYQSNGTSNPSISDPTTVLKKALSRVLVYYYPLAGKLKRLNNGKLQITCNGVDGQTAKLFALESSTIGYHPLVFQVTKFSCGGFTIGMGLSHSVCDGFGAAQFFQALAELASGSVEPSVKPVWERERLLGKASLDPLKLPVDKASLAASPYLPANNVQHEFFNVDGDSIKRLKLSLLKELSESEALSEGFSFTTVEALGAYVWRAKFRALEQNPNGKTFFHMAMGIRNLINPPLPSGFYGNAFVSSQLVLTVQQQKVKFELGGEVMILTDWRWLGLLEEVDFGWKRLDSSMEGGVRVRVSLPGEVVPRFKEEMEALKKLGGENGDGLWNHRIEIVIRE
ncbi:hypothetical protein LguiA_020801 [Lonicera macranthoides]